MGRFPISPQHAPPPPTHQHTSTHAPPTRQHTHQGGCAVETANTHRGGGFVNQGALQQNSSSNRSRDKGADIASHTVRWRFDARSTHMGHWHGTAGLSVGCRRIPLRPELMRFEASLFTSQLLTFRLVCVTADATRRIRPRRTRRTRRCSRSSAIKKNESWWSRSTVNGVSSHFTSLDRFDHITTDLVRAVHSS